MTTSFEPVRLFYSYAHEDEVFCESLNKHLILLQRQNLIVPWSDRSIIPGTEWLKEISRYLDEANIILLLISIDFLASDFCWSVELTNAMKRHLTGDACVIPVILRPCDWYAAPFKTLQPLPTDGRPISQWADIDEAWLDVTKGIRRAVMSLSPNRKIISSDTRQINQQRQRERWVLTINATIEELDREVLEKLTKSMRDISGDAELSIRRMCPGGSVVLVLDISSEARFHLERLITTGELRAIGGYEILKFDNRIVESTEQDLQRAGMLDAFPDSFSPVLPEFNQHGVLPPGDYAPDRASFEARFVKIGVSPVRQEIYAGWNRHRRDLVQNGLAPSARLLLNGSFTTAQEVPEDLELAVEVPLSGDLTAQLPPELAPVLALLQGPAMKALYQCDAYPIYSLPPDHELYELVTVEAIRYWTKWFGYTRTGSPKGRVWTTVGGWPDTNIHVTSRKIA